MNVKSTEQFTRSNNKLILCSHDLIFWCRSFEKANFCEHFNYYDIAVNQLNRNSVLIHRLLSRKINFNKYLNYSSAIHFPCGLVNSLYGKQLLYQTVIKIYKSHNITSDNYGTRKKNSHLIINSTLIQNIIYYFIFQKRLL